MAIERFEIDPDPRRARTPPAAFYLDPAWHALQAERVFARSWQLLLAEDPPDRPGTLQPATLLPGLLDEPVVLSRDARGVLRCLPNTCTHRGALLVDEALEAGTLRCRYHGRCFGLDGRLLAAPGFEGVEGFPGEDDHLRPLPLAELGPFLFAGLRPAVAFDELAGPMLERLSFLDWSALKEDRSERRDYDLPANWALYLDNYLEGFHVPFVHPGLAGSLELESYTVETFAWSSLQVAPAKREDEAFELPAAHPDHGRRVGAYYFFLFPTALFNFYPWGLSLNVVEPLGPQRTRIAFRSWVADPQRRGRGAGADLHRVELEDEAVVRACRDGLRSRSYRRGRYAPGHEDAVHHFHRLMAELLFGAGA